MSLPSVCYVLAEYPVPSQTFVHAEITALRAAGVRIGVVCHRQGDPTIRFGQGPDGVPLPLLHVDLSAEQDLDAVLAGFDHLHGHFADFGVRTLQPIAERLGKPFSFMCHAYDIFRRGAAVTPTEWRGLSPLCTKVATISRFHRDYIATRGVDPARIAVVPNAARLRALMATAPPPPTQLRRILAVGRPTPKKGFQVLLDAWQRARKHAPNLELELIGTQAPAGDLPPGLTLGGMRPYAQVLQAMAQADLVVAPCVVAPNGDMDGIPTVLAEAGALRRPVLSTRISGVSDLVAEGVNGLLVDPGDVQELAMALVRLAQRPGELQRMGAAGPRLAACHDASVSAERLISQVFTPPKTRPIRILVADSFSSANRGDAAILHGILEGLRERLPQAELQVLSHFPQIAERFHPGVQVMGDGDPVALAQALIHTDLVVSCGGSFLNDIYALNLGPRLAFYHAAHRAEIPVVFYAQSIGPLHSKLSRLAARQVLNPAAWILTRDAASAQIVRDLGVGCPMEVGVDAAISGQGDPVVLQDGLVLGVTVRHWHFPGLDNPQQLQADYEAHVAQACQDWIALSGGRVLLLSNCTDLGGYRQDDRLAALRVAKRITGPVQVEPAQDQPFSLLRGQAAACDFFLGTRMHSLIFATTGGVPSVGVAYEFKTPEYLRMAGLEGLSVDISDCSGLSALLCQAWTERARHSASLQEALPKLLAKSSSQLDQLAAIAQGQRLPRPISGGHKAQGWQGETFKYDTAHRRLRAVVDTVLGEGGRRVLDVGCSTGLVGRMLGPSFDYTGVDISSEVRCERPGHRILQADLNQEELPVDGPYDTVICSGSLEYLEDLPGILRQLRARTVHGGLAIFTLYNLSHFARATGNAQRHKTWRFDARPDELALALHEAGFALTRMHASAAGYTPSQAVNGERPTDWDQGGGGQMGAKRLVRLAHQVVFVCRAVPPQPGPQRVEALATVGDTLAATRVAVSLVKRFPWAARAWSDLGVLFHMAGDPSTAKQHLSTALKCDPSNPSVRENLADLGLDPEQAFFDSKDLELRLMLNPSDPARWEALIAQKIQHNELAQAAALHTLMRRAVGRVRAAVPQTQALRC